jgi:formate transporter
MGLPDTSPSQHGLIDALLPPDMAQACENVGLAKANRDPLALLVLGILAGAFIAFGGLFSTVVLSGSDALPWGVARLLAGLVFSLGLILVIVGGAELFTGDTLMVMAYASDKISFSRLLRVWGLVYIGNIIGSLATVALVFASGHYGYGGGLIGKTALGIATSKSALPGMQVLALSILCNVLVCLAVWMCFGARTITDKVMVIVPPIAAFVAAGFEHCVANMYLLPFGLAIKYWGDASFWTRTGLSAENYAALTPENVLHNISIATLGNLIGGSLLVGIVYWFVYLRPRLRT